MLHDVPEVLPRQDLAWANGLIAALPGFVHMQAWVSWSGCGLGHGGMGSPVTGGDRYCPSFNHLNDLVLLKN